MKSLNKNINKYLILHTEVIRRDSSRKGASPLTLELMIASSLNKDHKLKFGQRKKEKSENWIFCRSLQILRSTPRELYIVQSTVE